MGVLFEGIPVLLIFVILMLKSASTSKGKQGNKQAREAHLNKVAQDAPIWLQNAVKEVQPAKESSMQNIPQAHKRPKIEKTTKEKTHDHTGELRIDGTGLMEDRENDWLARQIREEARLGRRLMQ